MKKKRLVFTLKRGVTTNELFEAFDTKTRPESLYFSSEDINALGHQFPLSNETKDSEITHYQSPFYNSLGKVQEELYRTYTIDIDTEIELVKHLSYFKERNLFVENFYEDGTIKFFDSPNDSQFVRQRQMFDKLKIEDAWGIATKKGNDILVSVIDSGVQATHQDLADNLWVNPQDKKIGFLYSSPNMFDQSAKPNGHGTPVSGIIAAVGNNVGTIGIAPKSLVQMHMLKLTDDDETFMSNCVAAINNSIETNAKVVNCSFGIGSTSQQALNNFINKINIASKKMVFVFAAGNDGVDINNTFLSLIPDVLKVGALEINDEIANDSNFGDDVVFGYRSAHTTTKNNGFDSFNGTSAAAPQIAGICALILSYNPNIPPAKLREFIKKSCDKIPGIASDRGKGRVNARKALEMAMKFFGPADIVT